MKKILSCAAFATLIAAVAPMARGDLADIVPDGFARAVTFTVDGYDANRAPLTNFPVLVRISEAGISGFDYDDLNFPSTGDDLGFVDAQGDGLAFDIDTWDNGNNATSLVWVTLPVMTNGTQFAMCYRSSKSGKMVCDGNAFTNYVGVWHLNESGNSSSKNKITIYDSSTNSLTAKTGEKSNAVSDGVVGGARRITTDTDRKKEDQAIKLTYDSRVQNVLAGLGRDFSFSLWLRPQGVLTADKPGGIVYNGIIGRKSDGNTQTWHYQIADDVSRARLWTSQPSDQNFVVTDNVCSMTRYEWGRLDVVYTYETSGNAPKITVYWNGEKTVDNITPSGGYKVEQGDTTLAIGGYAGAAERPFCGDMDEVRIGTLLPSSDWVKADYDQIKTTSFLSAGTVEEFVEIPKPVAAFRLDDSGAAFAQFGGAISALGEGAMAASVLVQVWPTAGTASGNWTTLATGLDVDDSFDGIVTNLTPQTAYTYAIKAVNDLTPPYDSDVVTNFFTTSGAGASGTGGNAKRVGDDIVHTFTVDPDEGDTWTFVPPSYATNVEALVVAGGGPGGYYGGAGGGAGGLIYDDTFSVTGGATYTVKVGAGGVASSEVTRHGTNGGDSLITSDAGATTNAIAYGGGAGGNGVLDNHAGHTAGQDGGSGGGSSIGGMSGENGVVGTGVAGQGNDGGVGRKDKTIGGGGGGAGGLGGSLSFGATVSGGSGGPGREFAIAGTATYYAGGGGGGGKKDGGVPGAGGDGGGGSGGMETTAANADSIISRSGTDGLGGGGGGGSTIDGYYAGGNGGSGVVIIRYPIQGDGTTMPEPAVALTSASYDAETGKVSFTYRVAWAGYGYQVADVGIAWGYSPSALTTTDIVATDKIGSGSGTAQLPNVSKTVYLRAVATNAGGYSGMSVEQAVFTLFNPDAPVGTISVSNTGVTNALFSVDVTDFGTGASSASITVEVCASEDFTGTVLSFPAASDLSSLGRVSIAATGLAVNSPYYVRAIVMNSEDVELTTDAVAFTTTAPGAPVGTAAETDIGLTTLSASVRVTSFGTDADSATVRLEVSEVQDFSTLSSVSDETAAALNVDLPLTASGLSQDTTYYRRVRIRNWWGVDTYVALPITSTRSVPFVAAGPIWTASGDTVDISLAVAAVYDGATCTAVLTYGGETVGSRTFDAAGTVTWSDLTAKADGTFATIVVTAMVDEADYSRTFSAPVVPGANVIAVPDVSVHASAENALWMRPGDVAMLPDLYGDAFYQILNERFASIAGSTVAALEPGIVGIRCMDANYNTNVIGIVILPDAIGEGSIYVFKESKRNNSYDWARSVCWDKVENGARAASNDSYPQNADDIAILPFYTVAGDVYVRHLTDISLGGLYAGMIRPDAWLNCHLERYKDVTTKTVTFRRTDGLPVDVKTCPNSRGGNYSRIVLAGYDIDVVWASDAVIDGCSSETDVNGPRGRFYVKTGGSTNTLQDVTLTFQGYPGYATSSSECTDVLKGFWKGTGTIVKKGQGGIAFDGDFSGFSGTVIDMTGPTIGNLGAPAAGILMRAAGASNVTAHVYGWGSYKHDSGVPTFNGLSRGTLGTGGAGVTPDKGAQGPAKGLHMHGGTYRANKIDNATWGVGAKDEKVFDEISIGPGFTYITVEAGGGNGGGKPINAVTAKTISHTDKGTLIVYDPSLNSAPATSVTNSMVTIQNWADHAVGEAGDNQTTDVYPIIPWILVNRDSSFGKVNFASFDPNGRIVQPIWNDTYIDAVATNSNAYIWGKGLDRNSATISNITVNSMFLYNSNQSKHLGAGRTLKITSGGLVLNSTAAIGEAGRADNGTLILGDATKPAYVYAKAYGNSTNHIWSSVTADGGFVKAYTGNLILGGEQTGIAGELVVNSGTLALGSGTNDCALAKNLPVRVSTGATLVLTQAKTLKRSPVYLDSVGDVSGRIDLSGVESASVRKLLVRDLTQGDEWTVLRSGTYGSSGSNAEFVRDDLFVGNGILNVSGTQPSVFMVQ